MRDYIFKELTFRKSFSKEDLSKSIDKADKKLAEKHEDKPTEERRGRRSSLYRSRSMEILLKTMEIVNIPAAFVKPITITIPGIHYVHINYNIEILDLIDDVFTLKVDFMSDTDILHTQLYSLETFSFYAPIYNIHSTWCDVFNPLENIVPHISILSKKNRNRLSIKILSGTSTSFPLFLLSSL